jgi:phosphatidylglycerophosphate synthase/uncharacterized membrane protein YbhN (UPF0104 family)
VIQLPEQTILGRAVNTGAAAQLSRAVVAALGRAEDPNFTRLFGRTLSKWLSRRLAARGVTPNMVTLMGIAVGLGAAALIAQVGYLYTLAGAILLVFSRILDDCDGEVARLTLRQSVFGARLDVAGDIIVHAAAFLAVATSLHRSDPSGGYLWTVPLLLFGGAMTTVLVLGFVTGTSLPRESRLLRFMERSASGDFAYIFLVFAVIGRPQWFLWAAAIGAQFYWAVLGIAVLAFSRKQTATPPAKTGGLLNYVEIGLFAAGVLLLVLLVREVGWERLLADISLIGWGFTLVWAQEILAFGASTIGWMYAIAPAARRVPFLRLASFRLAGEGINHLTPTATMGGEFVRARLLSRHLGSRDGTAAVTLAKFAETAGQVLFITLGLALLLPFVEGLGPYRWGMMAVVCSATAGVVLLWRLLDRGFFALAARRLSALGIARGWFTRHGEEIGAIDTLIRECTRTRPSDVAKSIFWYGAAFAASAIEVWIILRLLGLPAPWHTVIGVEVLAVLIDGLLFFVPAKMGTQEGSKMLIFLILGLPPEKGLAMGLIRRARELVWDLVGLLIYAVIRTRSGAPDVVGARGHTDSRGAPETREWEREYGGVSSESHPTT